MGAHRRARDGELLIWMHHVNSSGSTARRFFAAAVIAGLTLVLFAGAARAETLSDALSKAYQSNPTLLAQRAALRATDELVSQALSGWRPTVTFNGDVGKSKVDQDLGFFATDETRTPRNYSLGFDQPLYRGGRTLAATEQAEFLVLSDRALLESVEQQVLFDAVTVYLDVLRDYAVLQLSRNNERVLERQLEAAQDRFEVGEVTRTDVAQAEARLSQALAERIEAEGQLIAARGAYQRVIGEMPAELIWPLPLQRLPGTEDLAREAARVAHPNIHAAIFIERAARSGVEAITGELLPEISLNATLSRSDESSSRESTSEAVEIAASLTVPLYQSGAVYSRVREAKQRAAQRRIEVDESQRDVLEEVTRAWEALMTARAQITAFNAQVGASEVALEGVNEEALVGLRTTLDVLDAEQELFVARVNLVRAQHDEIVSAYWLKESIGELSAAVLGLPVALYDATGHYDEVRDKWFGLDSGG